MNNNLLVLTKEIPFIFKKKLFVYLSLGFVAFTVIGTLSHEFGHYAVAKSFGWNPRIGYAYTLPGTDYGNSRLSKVYDLRIVEIKNNLPFPEKNEFEELKQHYHHKTLLMLLGGPVETILTSVLGIIIILLIKKKIKTKESLSLTNWISVFATLFVLRQTANMFVGLGISLIRTRTFVDDESRLSIAFGLNPWTISIITGVMGLIVLAWVIFRVIPIPERFTFILSGLFGGLSGYFLWLILLGPIILP